MTGAKFVLYGANGYTGELIAREAVRRGLQPVLAGRNREAVAKLASGLGCGSVAIGLDDVTALTQVLRGTRAVLHCAGPFSATAAPMMQACLAAGAHYLDITGEIPVFEAAHALDVAAREAGVVLCPGVGFDVVPTDCVAAELKAQLPDATALFLGFDSSSRPSRGTARTMVEGMAEGGQIRSSGQLQRVAHAFRERDIDFGDGVKTAVTIPWGDVSTAYFTTGIANIETYIAMPAKQIAALRRLNWFGALLKLSLVQSLLKGQATKGPPGPDEDMRRRNPTFVWGEAQAPSGEAVTARIKVANGYDVTVHAALGVLQHLLEYTGPGGYRTPTQLVGSRFVESLPGSGRMEIVRGRAWEPRPDA
jgi:short subunit dehydrogenase-like uncharacterized protein